MFGSSFFKYLQPLLEKAVEGRGLDPAWLAERLEGFENLPEEARDRQLVTAFGDLSQAANMPDLGFYVAENVPLTAFGTVSLGLPVAPTVGDALRLIQRYYRLISPTIIYDIQIKGLLATLAVALDHPPSAGVDQLVCGGAGVINRYISTYTAKAHNYETAELITADLAVGSACHQHLGVTPELGAMRNAFTFPARILNMPSLTADPKTFEAILEMCEAAELEAGRPRSILAMVQETVRAHVSAPPNLPQLAARAGVSERQLRFALTRAGTSYQAIVREARITYAKTMLGNPETPISTVAYRLGYADPANFTAAFKRWTGQTPRAVRNVLLKETENDDA